MAKSRTPSAGSPSRRTRRWGAWLAVPFWLIDAAVVAAVVLGLLAPYLHPRWFWWAQFAGIGLPFASLALVPLGLSLVLARRWRAAALHGVLLVLFLLRAGLPTQWLHRTPPVAPDDFVLLTYNLPVYGNEKQQCDSVATLVRTVQPTLVSLQEAAIYQPPRGAIQVHPQLQGIHANPAYTLTASLVPGRRDWTQMPFFYQRSALTVVDQEELTLVPGEPDVSQAVRTVWRWQGRPFVHYNVHLRSFGERKPWDDGIPFYSLTGLVTYLRQYRDAYRRRANDVERLRARLEEETLPVIVSGDLNGTPFDWGYHQLIGNRTDAFRVGGRGFGFTYRSDRPLVRIDAVLVDPAFEVVMAEVPAVQLSDHRPLVARFRWREAAE